MSGTITMTGEEYDAMRAEAEALRAENGRLQADRDRANKYANQASLELDGMRKQLAERDAVLREFCERVECGEVRSKATYAKFKALLSSAEPVKSAAYDPLTDRTFKGGDGEVDQ